MFKYELGQVVYYLMENEIHSAPILSRMLIENLHEDWDVTMEQNEFFKPFGNAGVIYHTCHGVIEEYDVYTTESELKESL